jgi:hypothetical protein
MRVERRVSLACTAALLIAALAALCIAPAVAAAMPGHAGAPAECRALLCQQRGCSTPSATTLGLPAATLASPGWVGVPVAGLTLPSATEPALAPARPVSPLAPRSPPLA